MILSSTMILIYITCKDKEEAKKISKHLLEKKLIACTNMTPIETIEHVFQNETAARTFLGYFLFTGDEPLKSNNQLSYGQRARLALAKMIVAGNNVLLLDEPINHLDIPGREQFEEALSHFSGTVIAVVHDRHFIDRFATEIWLVENQDIRRTIRQH